jgi:hypothetical protein
MDNQHDKPVNKTAALVVSHGIHFVPKPPPPHIVHSRKPLPVLPVSELTKDQRLLLGMRRGRLVVLGAALRVTGNPMAMYVVRCACGAYEHRTAKAIKNQKNNSDACYECRLVADRRRTDYWERYGVDKPRSELL